MYLIASAIQGPYSTFKYEWYYMFGVLATYIILPLGTGQIVVVQCKRTIRGVSVPNNYPAL